MKKRNLFSSVLSILMAAALVLPASAVDEDLLPPEPETVNIEQNPEEIPIPEEDTPEDTDQQPADPQEPEDSIQEPADPQEPEDSTQEPADPQEPENSTQEPADTQEPGDDTLYPVEVIEETADDQETDPDTVSVTVPSTGLVYLNPYHTSMNVLINNEIVTTTDQVIHAPQSLKNESAFPVVMDVEVIGSVNGGQFVGTPSFGSSRQNDIFMYVEFGEDAENWAKAYDTAAANQLLVKGGSTEKTDVLVLPINGNGYFRLSGTMNGATMWTPEENALTVKLVYTFEKDPNYVPEPDPEPDPDPNPETPDVSGDELGPDDMTTSPDGPSNPDDTAAPPEDPSNPDDTAAPPDGPSEPDDTATPPEDPSEPDDTATPPEDPSNPDDTATPPDGPSEPDDTITPPDDPDPEPDPEPEPEPPVEEEVVDIGPEEEIVEEI